MARPKFRFGVSMASFLPHVIGGAKWFADEALKSGFEIFQNLPLNGISGDEWFCQLPWSAYKEGDWNALENLLQAVFHQLGADLKPASIHDWIAFPSSFNAKYVRTKIAGRSIEHDFHLASKGKLVEINPSIGMSAKEIAEKAQVEGYELGLDTGHIFDPRDDRDLFAFGKPRWPFGSSYNEILQTIPILAPVKVVHVKDPFFEADQEVIRQFLASPNLLPQIDVILEFVPEWMSPLEAMNRAIKYLAKTKKLFGVS